MRGRLFKYILMLLSVMSIITASCARGGGTGAGTATSGPSDPTTASTTKTTETTATTTQPPTTTAPPATTEPPPPPEPVKYLVEPPPPGRSDELQKLITPISEKAGYDYFDGAVFIGDSVMTGFEIYKASVKVDGIAVFKNAVILAAKNYGVYHAISGEGKTAHPNYNGEPTTPESALSQMGAKRVYICFGLNDISWMTKENFVKYYAQLIDNIRERCPEIEIVILSTTPITKGGENWSGPNFNNGRFIDFNNGIIELAHERGVAYVDYAAALRDDGGFLIDAYASDKVCHITIPAYCKLAEYLMTHQPLTPEQKSVPHEIVIVRPEPETEPVTEPGGGEEPEA